jgi:hypothetical protein
MGMYVNGLDYQAGGLVFLQAVATVIQIASLSTQ